MRVSAIFCKLAVDAWAIAPTSLKETKKVRKVRRQYSNTEKKSQTFISIDLILKHFYFRKTFKYQGKAKYTQWVYWCVVIIFVVTHNFFSVRITHSRRCFKVYAKFRGRLRTILRVYFWETGITLLITHNLRIFEKVQIFAFWMILRAYEKFWDFYILRRMTWSSNRIFAIF